MSEDSAADPAIDLKKRARRRLVGAAALALLAVIILPIVMDSEPKPSGQEIQIRIPSQDSTSSTASLLPRGAAPSAPLADISKSLPVAAPAKADNTPDKAAVLPAASAVAADKPKTEDKPNAPAAKSDSAKKAEVTHAEAVLEGKDSPLWVVQLGAYQNAANVKLLTGKLKEMGLPSFTEKLESPQGARTRVRAGPFKSREQAEKASQRIKKIGVDGSVVQK